jgi:hypothetical protein
MIDAANEKLSANSESRLARANNHRFHGDRQTNHADPRFLPCPGSSTQDEPNNTNIRGDLNTQSVLRVPSHAESVSTLNKGVQPSLGSGQQGPAARLRPLMPSLQRRLSTYLGMVGATRRGGGGRDLGGDGGLPIPISARSDVRRRLSSRGSVRRLIPEWSWRLPPSSGGKRSASRLRLVGQPVASSSSRRAWNARLPILRAMVSLATAVLRRSRVAR